MGQICPIFQQHWYARESQKFQRTVPHHCPSPTAAPSPVISTKDLLHPSLPAFPRNTPFRQFIMTFCPGLSMRWTKARQSTNLTSSRASCYMHTYSSTQTHHLFCYGKNMHNIKLNILTVFTFFFSLPLEVCYTLEIKIRSPLCFGYMLWVYLKIGKMKNCDLYPCTIFRVR